MDRRQFLEGMTAGVVGGKFSNAEPCSCLPGASAFPSPPAPPGKIRITDVKTLAMSGRSVNEIARQTKMAQDAIVILMELQPEGSRELTTKGGEPRLYKAPSARKREALYTRYGQASTRVGA